MVHYSSLCQWFPIQDCSLLAEDAFPSLPPRLFLNHDNPFLRVERYFYFVSIHIDCGYLYFSVSPYICCCIASSKIAYIIFSLSLLGIFLEDVLSFAILLHLNKYFDIYIYISFSINSFPHANNCLPSSSKMYS